MKKEDLQSLFDGMEKKIGKENYSKIADDLGVILTDNETTNNTISNKENEIEKLTKNNEILITANGNLLQQVGMGEEIRKPVLKNENEEEKPKFSLKDAFDEKGEFKI